MMNFNNLELDVSEVSVLLGGIDSGRYGLVGSIEGEVRRQ
jgi:hypothetical protein